MQFTVTTVAQSIAAASKAQADAQIAFLNAAEQVLTYMSAVEMGNRKSFGRTEEGKALKQALTERGLAVSYANQWIADFFRLSQVPGQKKDWRSFLADKDITSFRDVKALAAALRAKDAKRKGKGAKAGEADEAGEAGEAEAPAAPAAPATPEVDVEAVSETERLNQALALVETLSEDSLMMLGGRIGTLIKSMRKKVA